MSSKLELVNPRSDVRNRLSASLYHPDSPLRWRGKVDLVSIETGIEGWVLDLDKPTVPLRLQLWMGDEVLAETSTGLKRPDVVALLGSDASPGFQFSPDSFAQLPGERSQAPMRIGLVDEKVEILGDSALPTLAQLRSAESAPMIGFDLMDRLGSLRNASASLVALPLRPSASTEVGYVELFSIEPGGLVWLQGWMARDAAIDASAAVVDGRKEPAGFVYTYFERDDLPSDKCGFVGVLHSSWTPSANTNPFIFLKGEALAHLNCVKPARIIKHRDFIASFKKLAGRCHTGPTAALLRLLENPDAWIPGDNQNLAAIDHAFLVPGFGCILSGWVLNALCSPKRFSLRLGATILSSDEASVAFRPRLDLATVATGCDALLNRAGFVAAFRGAISAEDCSHAVLKVFYEDGVASCHAIAARMFQAVGPAVHPEVLLGHYPALISEPFFPDMARALRSADRSQAAAWRVLRPATMRHAMVCVMAGGRPSAFLQTEQIRAHLRAESSIGVILIADEAILRSDALLLRESLVSTTGIACGVVCARRAAQAMYALDSVLSGSGCERFVFLGPGIFLRTAGWQAAFDHLGSTGDEGCFFGVSDPASSSEEDAKSAAAFGWTRNAISAWLAGAEAFLGGYAGENGLSDHVKVTHPKAAWSTQSLDGTPFVRAVNRLAHG